MGRSPAYFGVLPRADSALRRGSVRPARRAAPIGVLQGNYPENGVNIGSPGSALVELRWGLTMKMPV